MYYRLKDNYILRGWEKLPYAVVDREAGRAWFVDKEAFDALQLCDGQVDFDLSLVPQVIRDSVAKMEEKGFVAPCALGETIADEQKYHFYPNRFMRSAHWSITGNCNCKCRHCYISGAENRYGEISHDDAMKIAQGLVDCGVMSCSITGGEALVRRDFWEIIDTLRAGNISISQIYSNGLLVNERLLDAFEQRDMHPEFNMSFDGVGHHDWLRGMDGAEKAVRRAFELCRDRGFPTGAEMCLWKENRQSLRDSVNYLASVGCQSLKLNPVGDTGAWHEGGYAESHGLSMDETFEIYFDYLDDFYRDLPQMTVHLGGFFMCDGSNPDLYRLPAVHVVNNLESACLCAHARSNMYISAEGRALTCMPLSNMDEFQQAYPKIQEIGVRECLNDSKYMELINTRSTTVLAHNEKCRECPYRNVCLGGCRAAGMLTQPGDILAPDEATCAIYRDGWLRKIVAKVKELRPEAECVERKQLSELGLMDNLPGVF
nr:radical SAM protein [uncultured Butyrivibrio sp.]